MTTIATLCSKFREHDKGIDEAPGWMLKRQWKSSYNRKPEALPKLYGPLIRTDHKVELHRPEAGAFCMIFGMKTHRSGNTFARGMRCRHVPAVADVRSAATLVGAQVVSAQNLAGVFGDEDLVTGEKPVRKRLIAGDIPRQGVCLAGTEDRLKDEPDAIGISCTCGPYLHHLFIISF